MNRRERVVRTVAGLYAWAGGVVDYVAAAPHRVAHAARQTYWTLRPGIPLVRPLHCRRCDRTQRYVSRATGQLLAKGHPVRCWRCCGPMVRLDPQEPSK